MIVKEEFLNKLRTYFSLNLYEVKIWTALLSRGVSSAGELSDIGNVPRSRSYDVLESLEKKGFVVMKFGKPIKYMAVKPTEVVERVKKNMRIEAERKIKRLETIRNTEIVEELKSLYTQGVVLIEPSDLSGSLKGRHNIYNHFESIMKDAEKSVVLMTTAQGLVRKAEGLRPTLEKLKKKGVSIRIAAPITKDNEAAAKSLKGLAEVRHTDNSARFCIVDGKQLSFMTHNDEQLHPNNEVGIWVNTPFFASALQNMFEEQWKGMKPVR